MNSQLQKPQKSINQAIREAEDDLIAFLQPRLELNDYHDVQDKINFVLALNIRAAELTLGVVPKEPTNN